LLGAAVLLEDPRDTVRGHRGVVHVATVAVLFHAEDAVVVAYGADRDVDSLGLLRDALDDARICRHGHSSSLAGGTNAMTRGSALPREARQRARAASRLATSARARGDGLLAS